MMLYNFKFKHKDRPVTQGSVCGIWIRRFITVSVTVAVCVSFAEGMAHGLFVRALSMLVSAATAPSDSVATTEFLHGFRGRQQRSGPAEQVRRNDDGYVEGLATTLGYQSPELMATGSIGSGHAMAQR
jgi:hypothetical protein